MDRKLIFFYSVIIAALAVILLGRISVRGEQANSRASTEDLRANQRPLSAIIPIGKGSSRDKKHIAELKAATERLRIQRDSLQALLESNPGGQGAVLVDRATLHDSGDFVTSSLGDMNLGESKLVGILALTETESSAFSSLATDFRRELHMLERASAIKPPDPRDSNALARGVLEIPTKIAGKGELFGQLESALAELLGEDRGSVAYTWLSYNSALGRRDASKEYTFAKQADGKIDIKAHIRTYNEYLPGTTIPYNGEPGVEPDVIPGWGSQSHTTVDHEQAEAIFGNLIDLSNLPVAEPD